MELKELQKNLNLANDINTLNIKELGNKYLCNKESYSEFIKDYGDFFNSHLLYQLRIYEQYKKITELLSYGNIMYPDKTNELKEKNILYNINSNVQKYKLAEIREDELQAKYLFNVAIGKEKNKKERKSYEEVVSGMNEAAINYSKKDVSIGELGSYIYFLTKYESEYNRETSIRNFLNKNQISKCFNNVDFLYLANYIIKTESNLVDEKFIDDVKGIIEISEMLNNYNHKKDLDYKKVAKYTLNSVKKYEKQKAKKLK